MNHNDDGRDRGDERVIQSALAGHREYLRTAEQVHRRAAAALPSHPEVVGHRDSPITVAAAHRARSASFAQRGEFLEQIINFPASGLRTLTAQDVRTLQVPAHIGASAVSQDLGQQITDREHRARLAAARPAARASTTQASATQAPATHAPAVEADPETKLAPRRRTFDEIVYGIAPEQ